MTKRWAQVLCLIGLALAAPMRAAISEAFEDINGNARKIFDTTGKRGAVLLFYWHDCPICNQYAPELARLAAEFTNFSFYIVEVDPEFTPELARRHAAEFHLPGAVILDRQHRLVRRAGATATPEAVVFGAQENVLYRGRIDNVRISLSQRRDEATEHDLRDALRAIAAGRPALKETPPVGCAIEEIHFNENSKTK